MCFFIILFSYIVSWVSSGILREMYTEMSQFFKEISGCSTRHFFRTFDINSWIFFILLKIYLKIRQRILFEFIQRIIQQFFQSLGQIFYQIVRQSIFLRFQNFNFQKNKRICFGISYLTVFHLVNRETSPSIFVSLASEVAVDVHLKIPFVFLFFYFSFSNILLPEFLLWFILIFVQRCHYLPKNLPNVAQHIHTFHHWFF